MCRVCAITATIDSTTLEARRNILHHMLLCGSADDQKDGWGVSDGSKIIKSDQVYWKGDPAWMDAELNPHAIWMGHVRSASYGTERTLKAAHPYWVPYSEDVTDTADTNKLFIAMHNGTLQGTTSGHTPLYKDEPNSDSWRAFCRLRNLYMNSNMELENPALLEQWLNHFETGSNFVFMFMEDSDRLIAIRGSSVKTLYCCQLGDGMLINTSSEILESTRRFAKRMHGIDSGEVKYITENTVGVIALGKNHWEHFNDLKISLKPAYANNTQTTGHYPAVVNRQYDNSSIAVRQRGNWKRVMYTTPAGGGEKEAEELQKREIWADIRTALVPARQGICEIYAALLVNSARQVDGAEALLPSWVDYESLTLDELNMLLEQVNSSPLTNEQRAIVKEWNLKVDPCYDVDKHIYEFGEVMLWDTPDALKSIDQMKPKHKKDREAFATPLQGSILRALMA